MMPQPGQQPAAEGTVRLRLDLAYDGTDFAGWAKQPGLRTVQHEVEAALGTAMRSSSRLRVVCAGRTDAGVHARGQVAHADVGASDPLDREGRRRLTVSLRGLLPRDIQLASIAIAPTGFDARFSATSRCYWYAIADGLAFADPLRRREQLACRPTLDVGRMNEAALPLLGLHDFAAFCRARPGATTIRTLLRLEAERDASGVVLLRVEADAFCHSMVRSLAGALVAVGAGRRPIDWPAALLRARGRDRGPKVLPAHGLVLEHVRYPVPGQYASQAQRTRALRAAAGTCGDAG